MNSLSSFRRIAAILAAFALLPLAAQAAAKNWNVDMDHASVSFEINHFFTPVKARFLDSFGFWGWERSAPRAREGSVAFLFRCTCVRKISNRPLTLD